MSWILDHFLGRTIFDKPAQIHHGHAVTDITNYIQVMRDNEICQLQLLLQFKQKVQNLSLNRNIQC